MRCSLVEILGVVCTVLALACEGTSDSEDAIATLGPEQAGVSQGPLHRAGQPCLVCHNGTEATKLSVAGTIYARQDAADPLSDVRVELIDAIGMRYTAATNCAGNFFVRPSDFTPTFPLWVAIERDGIRQEMESPINGDGSCGSCHAAEEGPRSAGRVYLLPFGEATNSQCP